MEQGQTASAFVKVTELPVNGYLSIDGNSLFMNQEILKEDIAHLEFTAAQEGTSRYYGNFKFTLNDGDAETSEQSFVIDVDIVNEAIYAEKQQKEEKETLAFISKRKSDFAIDNSDCSWVDATSPSLFDDD